GPGDHEEWGRGCACLLPHAIFDGSSLVGIELFEIGDGHGLRIVQGVLSRKSTLLLYSQCAPRPVDRSASELRRLPRGAAKLQALERQRIWLSVKILPQSAFEELVVDRGMSKKRHGRSKFQIIRIAENL